MPFERLSALQPKLAEELGWQLRNSELPRSILFQGRRGTGRLTAALDLASALSDKASVVYLASRPFQSELRAAESLFLRQRNGKSRAFYIETVRRILLQYHSCLAKEGKDPDDVKGRRKIEGKAEEKEKNLFERAAKVDELLMELEGPGWEAKAESTVRQLSKRLDDTFLSFGRKTSGASIDDIRSVQEWLSSGLEEKCVIFENVEDCTEAAKNSLLKLLEEPHPHAHLILVSAHPGRLLETILSRVRKFSFPDVPPGRLNSFLRDQFFTREDYQSFDDFFFRSGAESGESEEMTRNVEQYYNALRTGKALSLEDEERIFAYLEKIKGYDQFREYVLGRLESDFRAGGLDNHRASRLYQALSRLMERRDTYNMSVRYALDLALREACDVN